MPSGVFTANAAWLVLAVIAFNPTRAAATLAAPATTSDRRVTPTVDPPEHPSSAKALLHLDRFLDGQEPPLTVVMALTEIPH